MVTRIWAARKAKGTARLGGLMETMGRTISILRDRSQETGTTKVSQFGHDAGAWVGDRAG